MTQLDNKVLYVNFRSKSAHAQSSREVIFASKKCTCRCTYLFACRSSKYSKSTQGERPFILVVNCLSQLQLTAESRYK